MKIESYLDGIRITYELQTSLNKESMKSIRKILKTGLSYKQITNQAIFIDTMKKRIKKQVNNINIDSKL